jgi:hypothetical protein
MQPGAIGSRACDGVATRTRHATYPPDLARFALVSQAEGAKAVLPMGSNPASRSKEFWTVPPLASGQFLLLGRCRGTVATLRANGGRREGPLVHDLQGPAPVVLAN